MNTNNLIAPFVQAFFLNFLLAQRGLSPNTIGAYRDCIKLFLNFAAVLLAKPVDKLTIEDFQDKLVVAFLDDLETSRNNATRTRNARLAALHALFRYIAGQQPEAMGRCQQICTVSFKRTSHKTIEYLEDNEIRAVLNSVVPSSRNALRDYGLLLLLYNTGARAQEIVDLRIDKVRFEKPYQVRLLGKGRKERACPLWPETVQALQNYIERRESSATECPSLFLNTNGKPITRFGLRYIIRQYADKAGETCASIKTKKISPHTVRHTTAMHLLQAGNDISVIKDWMGHADLNTTHGYVEIDMKMKRKVLEGCQPPKAKTPKKGQPKWLKPGILKWLDDLS
ncbi:MAG: site-specific integrase [Syntrophobacterales bacterium]|nr:site-specific integrase [Syntrophobacterales bacterium]